EGNVVVQPAAGHGDLAVLVEDGAAFRALVQAQGAAVQRDVPEVGKDGAAALGRGRGEGDINDEGDTLGVVVDQLAAVQGDVAGFREDDASLLRGVAGRGHAVEGDVGVVRPDGAAVNLPVPRIAQCHAGERELSGNEQVGRAEDVKDALGEGGRVL